MLSLHRPTGGLDDRHRSASLTWPHESAPGSSCSTPSAKRWPSAASTRTRTTKSDPGSARPCAGSTTSTPASPSARSTTRRRRRTTRCSRPGRSGSESAVTGRAYLLNVRSPFAVDAVGYVQLVVAKDRGGTFKRGDIAAEIMLDATTTPYQWTVTAPREGDSYTPKMRRRTAVERVLEVLGESAVPMTAEQVARIVNGPTDASQARRGCRSRR